MQWAPFLVYMFTTAVTPGPNNILSMENGRRKGFVRALPFNLGVMAGFSAISLASAFFLSALSRLLPFLKLPLTAVGAAYLLVLARHSLYAADAPEEQGSDASFLRGVALQFVNAKAYVYCMVSLEAFILPAYQGQPLQLAAFALMLSTAGFLCTLLWSAFGSTFRLLFSRHALAVNAAMAALLVYCAVAMLLG